MTGKRFKLAAPVAVAALLPFSYVHLFERPSIARDWSSDQSIVPRATFSGDSGGTHHVYRTVYRTTVSPSAATVTGK